MPPPDTPQMQRAARQGDPSCKPDFKKPEENTESTADVQAGFLRKRLSVGYCLAASLVPLIWGAGPR
jgi:hypothetical protein